MRLGKPALVLALIISAQLLLMPVASAAPAAATAFKADARGAVLIDPESGEMLFAQDPDTRVYPASVTKLMTLLLALEAVKDGRASLDEQVVSSAHAASLGGSQVWLEQGETFTLKEMLLAVAVGSANDASVAVAEHLGGSEEAFVEMMNAKAQELGAVNTHFVNPHGLHDPEHYTTAHDMGLIARYAVKNVPEILEFTQIKEYTFRENPKLVLYNTNKLLWWYPGTLGLKTGTTSEGGRSLVTCAERDGLRLLGVVLGVDKPNGHFSESIKLLNHGFGQFRWQDMAGTGPSLGEVTVGKGSTPSVGLVAADKVGLVVPKTSKAKIEMRIETQPNLQAPVHQGEVVGAAVITRDGQEVRRVPLRAANDVQQASVWQQTGKTLLRLFKAG